MMPQNENTAKTCPYVGALPFKGAQYVKLCDKLPNLCSCSYWNKPEVYNRCPTKIFNDTEECTP